VVAHRALRSSLCFLRAFVSSWFNFLALPTDGVGAAQGGMIRASSMTPGMFSDIGVAAGRPRDFGELPVVGFGKTQLAQRATGSPIAR